MNIVSVSCFVAYIWIGQHICKLSKTNDGSESICW